MAAIAAITWSVSTGSELPGQTAGAGPTKSIVETSMTSTGPRYQPLPDVAEERVHRSLEHDQKAWLSKRLAESSFWKLLSTMRSIGLKVLKNKLSEYVRLAAGGETVLVTDRDRVVAELIPPREGRSTMLADAQLAEAVRRGWVTPPVMVTSGPPAHVPVATLKQLLDELAHDRGDR